MRGVGQFVALCTATVVLAGCSSVQTGHAVADPAFTPNSDGAIVALLDHGNYPTKPSDPLGAAGKRGRVVEAQRMADYLVLPSDVDKSIADQGNLAGVGAALPTPTAAIVGEFVVSGVQTILESHHFVAGFAAQRIANMGSRSKAVTVLIARFPDPPTAADAATQMAAAPPPKGARSPFGIPRHPEALGSTFDAGDGAHYVESYTAHGPYVLYQFINSNESLDVAASLAAAILDQQAPRIDAFIPTDPAHLDDLPLDPTGLYAATLRADMDPNDFTRGVYGRQGGLAYEPNTVSMGDVFADTNVDAVAIGQSVIYRTKDAESARRFTRVLFADADADKTLKQIPPPPGLAKSRCIDASSGDSDPGSGHFQCVVTAGRYVFRVFSRQKNDVWQRAAAQYLMLTA
ncbi:hypothetical protein CIW52_00810 [Mycolicibacterium sp. P9-64]|uniref:DUF7373 family lipoprotein n=1 Tax=Mycolicibacterium sp. P9-64 TaxID=2024612 RepID=UPI0011ED0EA2|nr:hypothetical protein [Mycolicibacterium sp. P9-64]KAA0086510.1 hypothetical protein CIW52_00810 [Mycolicibacterium sp. P9-64]